MGVTQDTFNQYRDRAYEGQISTIEVFETFSLEVEGTPIKPGRAVVFGAGRKTGANVSGGTAAADVKGFSARTMAQANNTNDELEYGVGEVASVMRKGRMFLQCIGGAAKDATVHVVINVAGGDELGQVRGVADGGNTIELNQVKWAEDYADGEIGEIIVDGILTA